MASCVRNSNDPTYGPLHNYFGRTEKGQDDWPSIPTRHCTNRSCVQHELDLRQSDLLVPERFVHSNDQGKFNNTPTLAPRSY